MKSLNSAARRGAIMTVAALSALALASCSAGQVTQTSTQADAVDGASADVDSGVIALRDVTVHVNDEGEAGLKFVAINQDTSHTAHTLESVTIDGAEVDIDGADPLNRNCMIVADLQEELDKLVEPDAGCTQHVATSVENPGFAYGGNLPVEFIFDTGSITVDAAISAPLLESGTFDRVQGEGSN
ncbi:hypothetical protein CFAEC_11615 [Corynebacterium faecale]|nr:hypothetical protein CFAEC_11615 [Corynebacterium faecale]